MSPRIGVTLPRDLPIEQFVPFARRAEELGFDELWVIEDCFFRGGIAQAAVALASTNSITVGIGIMPAAARNPAFEALEIATLAELYPGRIIAGIGHGVGGWIRQVGAHPASPLTLLEEHLTALRGILRGSEVTSEGRYINLDRVALEKPLATVPPVYAGVRGPKSLALAGRAADGTILAEPVTPEYVAAAVSSIAAAGEHQLVAYNYAFIDDDPDAARQAVRSALGWFGEPELLAHIAPLPFAAEFAARRAAVSTQAEFAADLPDEWVDALALVGTPERVRERMAELGEAGATSNILIPLGADRLLALDSLARVLGG